MNPINNTPLPLTTIPEKNKVNEWGWYASRPTFQPIRRIPTYADLRQQSVLDGLEKVKAAETLVKMKNAPN